MLSAIDRSLAWNAHWDGRGSTLTISPICLIYSIVSLYVSESPYTGMAEDIVFETLTGRWSPVVYQNRSRLSVSCIYIKNND